MHHQADHRLPIAVLALSLVLWAMGACIGGLLRSARASEQYEFVVVRGAVTNIPILRVGGVSRPSDRGYISSGGAFSFRRTACEGAYNMRFSYPLPGATREHRFGRLNVEQAYLNGRRTRCPFASLALSGRIYSGVAAVVRDLGKPGCEVVRMRRGTRTTSRRYPFTFSGVVDASADFFDIRRFRLALRLRIGRLHSTVVFRGTAAFRGETGQKAELCLP